MNVFRMTKTDARNMDKWMYEVAIPTAIYYYLLFCYYLLVFPVIKIALFCYNIDKHVNAFCDKFDKADKSKPIITTANDAPDNTMTLSQFCHAFIVMPVYNLLPKRVVYVEDTKKIEELVAFNSRMLDTLMQDKRIAEKAVELAELTAQRANRADVLMTLAAITINELRAELADAKETIEYQNELIEETANNIITHVIAPSVETVAPNVVEVEAPKMEETVPNVFVRTVKHKNRWQYRPATKADLTGKVDLYKPHGETQHKKLTVRELKGLGVCV